MVGEISIMIKFKVKETPNEGHNMNVKLSISGEKSQVKLVLRKWIDDL